MATLSQDRSEEAAVGSVLQEVGNHAAILDHGAGHPKLASRMSVVL
jgi:hypothetical protein